MANKDLETTAKTSAETYTAITIVLGILYLIFGIAASSKGDVYTIVSTVVVVLALFASGTLGVLGTNGNKLALTIQTIIYAIAASLFLLGLGYSLYLIFTVDTSNAYAYALLNIVLGSYFALASWTNFKYMKLVRSNGVEYKSLPEQ